MCELSELSGRTCHGPGTIEYWYHLHSVWHLHLQFSSLGDFQLGLNVTPTSQKCIRWVEWKTITHTHLLLCVFHMHPELWTKSLFLEDLPSLPAHVKKKKKCVGNSAFPRSRVERKGFLVCGCRCYQQAGHSEASSMFHFGPHPGGGHLGRVPLVGLVSMFQSHAAWMEVLPQSVLMPRASYDPLCPFPTSWEPPIVCSPLLSQVLGEARMVSGMH